MVRPEPPQASCLFSVPLGAGKSPRNAQIMGANNAYHQHSNRKPLDKETRCDLMFRHWYDPRPFGGANDLSERPFTFRQQLHQPFHSGVKSASSFGLLAVVVLAALPGGGGPQIGHVLAATSSEIVTGAGPAIADEAVPQAAAVLRYVNRSDATCGGPSPYYATIQAAVTAAQAGEPFRSRPARTSSRWTSWPRTTTRGPRRAAASSSRPIPRHRWAASSSTAQ
jgi:hypothetical protein